MWVQLPPSPFNASTAVQNAPGHLFLITSSMKTVSGTRVVHLTGSTAVGTLSSFGDDSGPGRGGASCPYSTHRKQTTMHTRNSPDYQRTLRRWAELLRLQDERGLTAQEGRELRTLHERLHAVEQASSIAALTDDYAETMLREAGHIGGCEW